MRCFVICPIGEDGSDERARSDDLLKYVLRPALEIHDFDVIRADEIPGSGVITSEIIELVQNAELCIADLTGANANVYYEVGRRHETGLPWVQMIEEGNRIPFDLAGIRTIKYSLAGISEIHDAIDRVRSYIDVFSSEGFRSSSSGDSLSSLRDAVDRLTRSFEARISEPRPVDPHRDQLAGEVNWLKHPADLINEGLAQSQPAMIEAGLQRLFPETGPSPQVLLAVNVLLRIGSKIAAGIGLVILRMIRDQELQIIDFSPPNLRFPYIPALDGSDIMSLSSALQSHYSKLYQPREPISPLVEAAGSMQECGLPGDVVGFVLNQAGMAAYQADDFDESIKLHLRAFEVNPTVGSYLYNAAVSARDGGSMTEATEIADQLRQMMGDDLAEDDDHYRIVVELLSQDETRKSVAEELISRFGPPPKTDKTLMHQMVKALGIDPEVFEEYVMRGEGS